MLFVLRCSCHYIVCKLWYTLCDIAYKYITKLLTLEIQYTFNTKVRSTTVLVWLHSILWNSFRLLLLSRKWLNADDCCVMIVICMFYCEIYRCHCLLVLLKCKKRLIIIFSNLSNVGAKWPLCEYDCILYYCRVWVCIFMLIHCVYFFFKFRFLYLKKQGSFQWLFWLFFWCGNVYVLLDWTKKQVFMFRFFSINVFFYERLPSLVFINWSRRSGILHEGNEISFTT